MVGYYSHPAKIAACFQEQMNALVINKQLLQCGLAFIST